MKLKKITLFLSGALLLTVASLLLLSLKKKPASAPVATVSPATVILDDITAASGLTTPATGGDWCVFEITGVEKQPGCPDGYDVKDIVCVVCPASGACRTAMIANVYLDGKFICKVGLLRVTVGHKECEECPEGSRKLKERN